MLKNQFYTNIKELYFPQLPEELENKVHNIVKDYVEKDKLTKSFTWTNDDVSEINQWAWKNISKDLHFGIFIIDRDIEIHVDRYSNTKLSYYLNLGGDDVTSTFYRDREGNQLLEQTIIQNKKWYTFNAQVWHTVQNVTKLRYGISTSINHIDF